MTWLYILKEYIMNNKPITINTNATINGVTVFKLVVELPHGLNGLDGKFATNIHKHVPSPKSVTEEGLVYLGYKIADVSKTNAPGETAIWLKDGHRAVFVDDSRAFFSKDCACYHPVTSHWFEMFSA
jgi:hypothetical protein